jgi:hypothetical protein
LRWSVIQIPGNRPYSITSLDSIKRLEIFLVLLLIKNLVLQRLSRVLQRLLIFPAFILFIHEALMKELFLKFFSIITHLIVRIKLLL